MKASRKRSTGQRRIFLAALAEGLSVTAAVRRTGISRRHWYRVREADPAFLAAWDEAVEEGTDALEDEALRRAVHGVDEPVHHKGEVCGVVRRYSDTLLMFLLRGWRREKFGDKRDVKLGGLLTLEQLVLARRRADLPPGPGRVGAADAPAAAA